MGTRSAPDTIAAIMLAFVDQRTWRQAELAERVGITTAALRKRLLELQAWGMPLEQDREDPQVYWSVPKGWFPGGVVVAGKDLEALLRVVLRAHRGPARDQALRILAAGAPRASVVEGIEAAVVTPALGREEESWLSVLEDAASRGVPAHVRYASSSSIGPRWRVVTVHRVVPGSPVRLVVTCHEKRELRWFRLDHVSGAKLADNEQPCIVDKVEIDRFLGESVGGYHAGGAPVELRFLVRDPEARWVAENVEPSWQRERVEGGLRVSVRTSSVGQVARYVVGLGAAAAAETPELREQVRQLALGALHGTGPGVRKTTRPAGRHTK